MLHKIYRQLLLPVALLLTSLITVAQNSVQPKYNNSSIYTGIEVGSKGVKMSIIEIGKNAQSTGAFNIIKDTSVNTDFISSPSQHLMPPWMDYMDYIQKQQRI